DLGKYGRPDLLIRDQDNVILLESKFGAAFQTSQLKRYADYLKSLKEKSDPSSETCQQYSLVLIAPKNRLRGLRLEADNMALAHKTNTFNEYCNLNPAINFQSIAWEDVVITLDNSVEIQRELRIYIMDHLPLELTRENIDQLSKKSFPDSLSSLYQKIRNLQTNLRLDSDSFKLDAVRHSYNWYGFKILSFDDTYNLWIGMILEPWSITGIPIYIQVREDWVKRDEFLKVKNILIELGFKEDKQYSYLLPIPFEKLSSMEDTIINICNRLDKAFTSQS
ncbi:MAG: hypothetical protein HN590_12430, partial [Calditrichaeota bacterium]|nr:hypothetical protein [Calditrichota bacterium]